MGRPKTTPIEFWKKVDKTLGPDKCWPWLGAVSKKGGAGKARLNYKCVGAHFLAYYYTNGHFPDERGLDRLCQTRSCCNPTHYKLGPTQDERFWSFVNKNGPVPNHCPNLGNCWVWKGHCRNFGHGTFWANKQKTSPHRYSYTLHNGPIPSGLGVLHKCDTPGCCRPDHLFLGDQSANMQDAASKGRTTQGTKNSRAKLTEDQVREIRQLVASGERRESVATKFGLSKNAVTPIVNGTGWKHVK